MMSNAIMGVSRFGRFEWSDINPIIGYRSTECATPHAQASFPSSG
jgi:hypothetical protein